MILAWSLGSVWDNRIHTSGEMQAGCPTGRNAAAFTEARCNANQEPKKLTKNTSPVHKRRMLNTKTKINLATKKTRKSKQPCHQPSAPLQRKKINENVHLWIDPPTTFGTRTIRSQVCTFKCRSRCKSSSLRDPEGEVFHPDHNPTGRLGLGLPLGNRGKYPAKRDPDVKSSTQKYRYSKGGYC